MALPRVNGQKTILVTLINDRLFHTNVLPHVEEIELGDLATLGPMINRWRIHWEGVDFTQYFKAKIGWVWSVTGRIWSTPETDFLDWETQSRQIIGPWKSDTSLFGLNHRVFLHYQNIQDQTDQSGRITAVLEIELKS